MPYLARAMCCLADRKSGPTIAALLLGCPQTCGLQMKTNNNYKRMSPELTGNNNKSDHKDHVQNFTFFISVVLVLLTFVLTVYHHHLLPGWWWPFPHMQTLGKGSTDHCPPALFFFMWRSAHMHQFQSVGYDQSTVAH